MNKIIINILLLIYLGMIINRVLLRNSVAEEKHTYNSSLKEFHKTL